MFGLFKRKNIYKPCNRLEEIFWKAASNPGYRPDFARQIFHFPFIVLGNLEKGENGERTAKFLLTETDGLSYVQAYTSKEALEYVLTQNKLPAQNYLELSSLTLFQMIQGKLGIHLNPGHDYQKTFTPKEIANLLSEEPVYRETADIKKGTSIKVGQPNSYPKGFLDALKSFLKFHDCLSDIFVGIHQVEEQKPSLLVALALKLDIELSDKDMLVNDLIQMVHEYLGNMALDITFVSEDYKEMIVQGALIPVLTKPSH